MDTFKKILRWALVVFFLAGVIVYMPSVTSVLFLLGALLCAPVKAVSALLEKCRLRGKSKAVAVALVFVAGALLAPAAPKTEVEAPAADPSQKIVIRQEAESEDVPSANEEAFEQTLPANEEAPAQTPPADEKAAPEPDTIPEAADAAQPEPEGEAMSEPEPTPAPEPAKEPEPVQAAEPVAAPEPAAEPEPESTPEPEPEPVQKQEPAPEPQPAAEEPQSQTVYVTKTGKRYHYDNHCNGGTYYESTIENAIARGLTPCKKCVG